MRRPPRPPLPPSAHDVRPRGAASNAPWRPTDVPVPAVVAICEDEAVIGAPFYVMQRVDGDVDHRWQCRSRSTPRAERAAISTSVIDALVALHDVDYDAVGLGGLGRPAGYLERQLKRFAGLWEANATRAVPDVDRVHTWLAEHLPETQRSSIVHGDYRLGNVLFARDAPARRAGDPRLGDGHARRPARRTSATSPRPGRTRTRRRRRCSRCRPLRGCPVSSSARRARATYYEERSGHPAGDLRWYQVLALWKACVFLESSYARYLSGTTSDEYFATLGDGVPALARAAAQRCG